MLHVIGTLNVGGVQRLVLGMAASPAGSAYRHSALCLFGASGDLKERFAEAGISVSSCGVPWPPKLDVGSYRLSRWLRQRLAWSFPYRFAREITRLGAELVHSHVYAPDRPAGAGSDSPGPPSNGLDRSRQVPSGRAGARALAPGDPARGRRRSDHSGRRGSRPRLPAAGPRPSGRHRGDPRGHRVVGVSFASAAGSALAERWGIGSESIVFGASGRLVSEKAYEVFVRAAGRIVREGADAHFVIAGGGPLRKELESEIAAAGLEGRFHLVGFVENVLGFLRELDVFVLSSRFEGFPIALVEALAAGLPAIATPWGACRRWWAPTAHSSSPRSPTRPSRRR